MSDPGFVRKGSELITGYLPSVQSGETNVGGVRDAGSLGKMGMLWCFVYGGSRSGCCQGGEQGRKGEGERLHCGSLWLKLVC